MRKSSVTLHSSNADTELTLERFQIVLGLESVQW